MKNKLFLIITMLVAIFATSTAYSAEAYEAPKVSTGVFPIYNFSDVSLITQAQPNFLLAEDSVMNSAVIVLKQLITNSSTQTVIVSLQGYSKFTFVTGAGNSDTASWVFTLYGGVGGSWEQLWKDSVKSNVTATSGVIGTDAKYYTYNMKADFGANTDTTSTVATAKIYPIYNELKWVRANSSTGNSVGPNSIKTWANDWIIKTH